MDHSPGLTPETIKDKVRKITSDVDDLSDLPISYAKFVRNGLRPMALSDRLGALRAIRKWSNYAKEHSIDKDDLFMLRHHITNFAEQAFTDSEVEIILESVGIEDVLAGSATCEDVLSQYVNTDSFHDRDVAVVGGVARLALKMYAGVDISSELPPNDIDVVVNSKTDIERKSVHYGFDITGAKVVAKDIERILPGYITKFDCTMNEVAVHDGRLLFTPQSLADIKDGSIRVTTREDALFGSDAIKMDDDHIYLMKSGFYRGLSFLFRGKGDKLVVSQENIDQEKDNIGRYWLVMLYVKLLKMGDSESKKSAIGHWHDVAKRIGSTDTDNPEQFLYELAEKYPMMSHFASREESDYDNNAQARWLIGKLANRSIEGFFTSSRPNLPETYTSADIALSDQVPDYDLDSFISLTSTVFEK